MTGGPLTERVAKLLARYQRQQVTDPEQHVEAPYPGHLGCQDTYFVGTLKGVGRVYAQTSSMPTAPGPRPSCTCRSCR